MMKVMEKITLKSWEEFEAKVGAMLEKPEHLQPLFRGQKPVRLNEKSESD
jgi:hypothetical protein